jgi:hypothetical protein
MAVGTRHLMAAVKQCQFDTRATRNPRCRRKCCAGSNLPKQSHSPLEDTPHRLPGTESGIEIAAQRISEQLKGNCPGRSRSSICLESLVADS